MSYPGVARRRSRRKKTPDSVPEAPDQDAEDRGEAELTTGRQPPRTPSSGADTGSSSGPNFDVVFQMTRDAIDLQFKVAERIDTKARNYFAFAAATFGIAQALALRGDVRENLGTWSTTFEWLALGSAGLLLGSVLAAVCTLLPRSEADVPEEKLRSLLKQSHQEDPEAGVEGVNFLIGELTRRRKVNRSRGRRLTILIVVVGLAAFVAVLEIAVAVRVVL